MFSNSNQPRIDTSNHSRLGTSNHSRIGTSNVLKIAEPNTPRIVTASRINTAASNVGQGYSINRRNNPSTPAKHQQHYQLDNYSRPPSTSSRSITSRLSLRPDTRALVTSNGSNQSPRPITSTFVPSQFKNTTTGNQTASKRPANSSYFRRKK